MEFLSIIIAIGLLITFTLLQSLISQSKRGKRLPPGPTRFPIIGSLHLLGSEPHKSLTKLAKKHGPLMSLKLGQITTIVISSSEMAKEVLKTQDLAFSSRSVPDAFHAFDEDKYSVIWLPVAARWRSLRKMLTVNIFSVKRLDDSQHLRTKKVQELLDYCRKCSETGQAVNVGRAGFRTALNLMTNIIFSQDLTDPSTDSGKEFRQLVWNMLIEAGKPNLADFFPILSRIDPQGIRRRMIFNLTKIFEIFNHLIDERLKSGVSHGDVLDVLLTACKESPEIMDRTHIEHMCLNLFAAATDTTSSTLEWAMSELIKNPPKMKKAQHEIAQVVGKGTVIKESDVAQLPYLRSVVKEALRIHPPVPFLIPRRVEQEVEVCGYTVPKGSQVLVNVWALGRDETLWKDALTFKPERFLESGIDLLGQDFELLPFGGGRRICPGLPLGLRMAHVMLGSLLNCFDWKLEGENAPEDLEMGEQFGISLQKARPLLIVPIPL